MHCCLVKEKKHDHTRNLNEFNDDSGNSNVSQLFAGFDLEPEGELKDISAEEEYTSEEEGAIIEDASSYVYSGSADGGQQVIKFPILLF